MPRLFAAESFPKLDHLLISHWVRQTWYTEQRSIVKILHEGLLVDRRRHEDDF